MAVCSPEKRDEAANELVDYAAVNGHVNVARMLLQAGVDKDTTDELGMTALGCASSSSHVEIVRLLLDAGADKDPNTPKSRK